MSLTITTEGAEAAPPITVRYYILYMYRRAAEVDILIFRTRERKATPNPHPKLVAFSGEEHKLGT